MERDKHGDVHRRTTGGRRHVRDLRYSSIMFYVVIVVIVDGEDRQERWAVVLLKR